MKYIKIILCSFLLFSCSANNNKAGVGLLITDTIDPIFVDNNVKAFKIGKSCSYRILSLIVTGNASIDSAKKDGQIKKVSSASTEHFNLFGIYGHACTVITGE